MWAVGPSELLSLLRLEYHSARLLVSPAVSTNMHLLCGWGLSCLHSQFVTDGRFPNPQMSHTSATKCLKSSLGDPLGFYRTRNFGQYQWVRVQVEQFHVTINKFALLWGYAIASHRKRFGPRWSSAATIAWPEPVKSALTIGKRARRCMRNDLPMDFFHRAERSRYWCRFLWSTPNEISTSLDEATEASYGRPWDNSRHRCEQVSKWLHLGDLNSLWQYLHKCQQSDLEFKPEDQASQ